jgi:hypothetical protein
MKLSFPTGLFAFFTIVIAEIIVARAQTVSSTNVNAGIDRWSKENRVVVTKEVRENVAGDLAFEVTTNARHTGLSTVEAWHLGGAIADGGVIEYRPSATPSLQGKDATGRIIFSSNPPKDEPASAEAINRSKWDWIRYIADYSKIGRLLQKYPQIHLIVQPVPPRDYSVKVNGSTYEATERSLYGVPPGVTIVVRVERSGKPPCQWSGIVFDGQVQMVDCTL